MRVSEIFDSIDGEGIRTGMCVTFIRLCGCNLRCGYCDTKYSWSMDSGAEMTEDEILDKVNFKRVTLTGGEPLIHPGAASLIKRLASSGHEVNIETNGAADISGFKEDGVFFTIDYKLPSSGEEDKMLWDNFTALSCDDVIKFVVGSEEDADRMTELVTRLKDYYKDRMPHIFAGAVFESMPPSRLAEYLISHKELEDVRLQLQIHKYIWDPDMRGV